MAQMDYTAIFEAFYTQYRAEATVPTSAEDEYTIGMRLANEAVNRWANYDNTYWRELFTTNQLDGSGALTVVNGQTVYTAPENFKEAGGYIRLVQTDGATAKSYPIIEPHEAQMKGVNSTYAFFSGSFVDGYTLTLNDTPDSSITGLNIDFVYYKTPTEFETGTDVTEVPDPYFIVHRMLANRFRASRNPYYNSALRDAEDSLKIMQMTNNSGNWSAPWSMTDNSGAVFGEGQGTRRSIFEG